MCFSAEASFAGAAVVSGIGVATLTQVRQKREVVFASLPFAFAVHQFLEGMTWVSLDGREEAHLSNWSVHAWVIYAWALLPTWLPVGVYLLEPEARRRRWMVPFIAIGLALTAFMVVQALSPEIEVSVVESNLDYQLPVDIGVLLGLPYVLTTCVAPMLSSLKLVRVFGIANLGAVVASAVWKAADFSSVWCTMAAGLSAIILIFMIQRRRDERAATETDEPTEPAAPASPSAPVESSPVR